MRTIGAFEAKNTLGALLDKVEKGDEVVITRRGRPVARLVRETLARNSSVAVEAAARLKARASAQNFAPSGWTDWKSLRDEGRK